MTLAKRRLGDLFVHTRASESTYWAADGSLKTAAIDEPCFDHDPETGIPLGIMCRRETTNEHRNGDLSLSVDTGSTKPTYSLTPANDPYLPDAKIAECIGGATIPFTGTSHTSVGEGQYGYPMGTNTSAWAYTVKAIRVKAGDARYVSLRTAAGPHGFTLDLVDEQMIQVSGPVADMRARKLQGGWWELAVIRTAGSGASGNQYWVAFGNQLSGTYDITVDIGDKITMAYPEMYGVPAYPKYIFPPIISRGADTTRALDDLRTSSPQQAWLASQPNFSLYMEWNCAASTVSTGTLWTYLVKDGATSVSQGMFGVYNSFNTLIYTGAGDGSMVANIPMVNPGINKLVITTNGAQASCAHNGVTYPLPDALYDTLITLSLNLVALKGNDADGWLRKVAYYPEYLDSPTMEAMTS